MPPPAPSDVPISRTARLALLRAIVDRLGDRAAEHGLEAPPDLRPADLVATVACLERAVADLASLVVVGRPDASLVGLAQMLLRGR